MGVGVAAWGRRWKGSGGAERREKAREIQIRSGSWENVQPPHAEEGREMQAEWCRVSCLLLAYI